MREALGIITSVFSKPVRFGILTSFSGFPPDKQANVQSLIPAEAPEDTNPHSAPVSSASRFPTPSTNSSIWTFSVETASMASLASGLVTDPPIMVFVPLQLINGSTPIDFNILCPLSASSEPGVLETPDKKANPFSF